MFERKISEAEIRSVIDTGQVIERYPDDVPYPSRLVLGWASGRAIHVVAATSPILRSGKRGSGGGVSDEVRHLQTRGNQAWHLDTHADARWHDARGEGHARRGVRELRRVVCGRGHHDPSPPPHPPTPARRHP